MAGVEVSAGRISDTGLGVGKILNGGGQVCIRVGRVRETLFQMRDWKTSSLGHTLDRVSFSRSNFPVTTLHLYKEQFFP